MLSRSIKSCKSVFVIFSLASCLMSCSHENGDRLNPDQLIAGHAGSGFNYLIDPFNPLPANSWASIKRALKDGADGIEIDIQLSSDKKLVLYHDIQLDSKTELKGCIADKRAEDLFDTKYRLGFPYDIFHNEKLLGLEQLILHLEREKLTPNLYFDLKHENECNRELYNGRRSEMLESLISWKIASDYPSERLTIISASDSILSHLARAMPEVAMVKPGYGDIKLNIDAALDLGFDGLIYSVHQIESNKVREIQNSGLQVILFGGKSYQTLTDMIHSGADVIQVNNVAKAQRIRRTMIVPEQ